MNSNWTEDQKNAIESTGGTVLVSAAAGSGKTSVLVQRVLNAITNETNPIDITDFLIVTFTNMAAQEMKNRISSKLSEMILKNPKNSNLYRQQMLLKSAKVGTIDSFCLNLVKENFFSLNISPNFKIAEETEIKIIKSKAAETTLNYFYEKNNKDFLNLVNLLTNEKNDNELTKIIDQIYDFTRSVPLPKIWMDKILELYKPAEENTSYWETLMINNAKSTADACENIIKNSLQTITNFPNIKKSYEQILKDDLNQINRLTSASLGKNYDEIYSVLSSFSFSSLKPVKNPENNSVKDQVKEARNYAKDLIGKLKTNICSSHQENKSVQKATYNIVKTLFDLVTYYENEIFNLKLAKNILSFSDIEHLTIKLLTNIENGEIKKSQIAKELSAEFKEIMVDEYQDINETQDMIFKMITKNESNIFMVGDVKQSIYKFRQSKPEIFLEKKEVFNNFSKKNPSYPTKIILGKNFRSENGIIGFINFIFENLMSKNSAGIEYNKEEQLISGLNEKENPSLQKSVDLKIINLSGNKEDKYIIESQAIAKTITKMIAEGFTVKNKNNQRPATYSDFCILLRSANKKANIYAKELFKCGIPCKAELEENFLSTKEITSILSVLEVVNNPIQDIPLMGAMINPIFNFTIDEISALRIGNTSEPLYFTIKKAAENGNPKLTKFIKQIEHYRRLSSNCSCNELIDYIYKDTDFSEIFSAMENGETKKTNLMYFMDYAKNYESHSHNGLDGFLKFIKNIKEKGGDLKPAPSFSGYNTVKIMSIHKSKGLEFPICILADCSGKFNNDTDSIVIHSELGIGTKLKDEEESIKYDNIIRKSISLQNKSESMGEELRILYVALTRAKQKLILITSFENPQKELKKYLNLSLCNTKNNPYIVKNASSFAQWIFLSIIKSNCRNKLCNILDLPEEISEETYPNLDINIDFIDEFSNKEENKKEEQTKQTTSDIVQINENLLKKFEKRFAFIENSKPKENLPLKIAASKLASGEKWKEYIASSCPAFLLGEKLTPSSRGTAMHNFMCYSDFNNIAKFGIDYEIKYLYENKFLSKEEIQNLDRNALTKFTNSDLFGRILKSKNVLREHRFSVSIPAKYIFKETSQTENIVVEGALDCAFKENGKYVIVDYKTDKTDDLSLLYEKYSRQLKIYKYALSHIEETDVLETGIYSFYMNDYFCKY